MKAKTTYSDMALHHVLYVSRAILVELDMVTWTLLCGGIKIDAD